MVAPRLRSRSVKKLFRVSPGGNRTVIYKMGKPAKAPCAYCGAKLNAVPNRTSSGMRKLSKTQKRPERVFGGVLCGNCAQSILKAKLRLKNGVISKEDIPLKMLGFVKMLK